MIKNMIRELDISDEEKEIVLYGLKQFSILATSIAAAILIGIMLGELKGVIFFLVMFIPLRVFAGGLHMPKLWICSIASSMLIVSVALMIKLVNSEKMISPGVLILCVISGIIIIILAPVDTNNKRLFFYEKREYKIISTVFVLIELAIAIFFHKVSRVNMIAEISLMIESVYLIIQSIINLNLRGIKKVDRELNNKARTVDKNNKIAKEKNLGGGSRVINIAICDDEASTCKEVEDMLFALTEKLGTSISTDVYYSGEGLIKGLQAGNSYGFIILDIELAELNGVDVGKFIREEIHNFHTQIIYISSKTTYAMQLFSVQPLDFIGKPITEESLFYAIRRGLEIIDYSGEVFVCKIGRDNILVECREILYLESNLRSITLVCKDEKISFYGKISECLSKLPECFVRIHNSYVVNMNAIKRFGKDYVLMNNGDELQISRKFSESFSDRLFRRMKFLHGEN